MKNPTQRSVRKMLITTLGRIERGTEALEMYKTPDDMHTEAELVLIRARIMRDIEQQRAKLREYNSIAATLVGMR